MKTCCAAAALAFLFVLASPGQDAPRLRPPAVPLVVCDPYFSIWSPSDVAMDADTVHWTGHPQRLGAIVRIDGQIFHVLGGTVPLVPSLPQAGLEILPTTTLYRFQGPGVRLSLALMTPMLPDDLMVYARPVTYLTWTAEADDGRPHRVEVYFNAGAEISVNEPHQDATVERLRVGDLAAIRMGSVQQRILGQAGDDVRIDWGHFYMAAPGSDCPSSEVLTRIGSRAAWTRFAQDGILPPDKTASRTGAADGLMGGLILELGSVGAEPVSRWLMVAYDDEYSIQYFQQNLRPYWRRGGDDAEALLGKSEAEYADLVRRCGRLDADLMSDLRRAGGERYARLCALAYRQCAAGTKVAADRNGAPLVFSKENTSNGCIATVDVIYPMSPMFLLFSPALAEAMLVPPLDYASSPKWKFPFAPHDLGRYPWANGQVYGGGEKTEINQMPVEESGNLLVIVTALTEETGSLGLANRYWPLFVKWAEYLKGKGFDPESQLCTDDFAGHLAHNVNLSAKAIIALGAFGRLASLRGDEARAAEFTGLAREYAARWVREADDVDHFRLAYDQPGTWSQKYNLIWDRLLGLDLFPASALRKEMAFYAGILNRYGLPLDNRRTWVELPWTFWTACLTGSAGDFDGLVNPVYGYVEATSNRVPFADFYWTKDGREAGMHARPVIGGIFMKALLDHDLARKWEARAGSSAFNWAPFPLGVAPPVPGMKAPSP